MIEGNSMRHAQPCLLADTCKALLAVVLVPIWLCAAGSTGKAAEGGDGRAASCQVRKQGLAEPAGWPAEAGKAL